MNKKVIFNHVNLGLEMTIMYLGPRDALRSSNWHIKGCVAKTQDRNQDLDCGSSLVAKGIANGWRV